MILLTISLKTQKEFDAVNKIGKKIYTPFFLLIVARKFIPPAKKQNIEQNTATRNIAPIFNSTEPINPEAVKQTFVRVARITANKVTANKKNRLTLPPDLTPAIFFGMKVSKKISKKAVVRNKIKRRIRHLVRNIPKILSARILANKSDNIKGNIAFIVIPQKSFEKAEFNLLQDSFDQCFSSQF